MVTGAGANRLVDGFGRRLDYLRLSLTERCNFRCTYCLPNGCVAAARGEPLSLAELERLVGGFAELGFWKVRLTGGEPTLRPDVVEIVRRVAATPGIRRVGMTTNGYRLQSIARALAGAGLDALNVSIDSLDARRFASITGRTLLSQVLAGVEEAIAAGIPSIKVNVVLLAETGDEEVDRFLEWTRRAPLTVRFIELMEAGDDPAFFERQRAPTERIADLLVRRGWSPLPWAEGDGPATNYARPGHEGRVGIIASREHACARCNRLRVSASGHLKLCLYDRRVVALRHLLRSDEQRDALVEAVRVAVGAKPSARPAEREGTALRSLSSIGG